MLILTNQKKVLSVFSLVMINVIAVDSLRTLPISAKLGLPLIFFYLAAALTFFIPIALVAAELATLFPHTGGVYVWVREAFGKRAGFLTIWLQWIYNVVWYPTIMAFIAATVAYLFSPDLANNETWLLTSSIGFFWIFTFLNCFGMRVSGIVSIIGAIFGTLLPMIGIIVLGFLWFLKGNPLALHMSDSFFPNTSHWGNLSLFSVILFGLIGVEMSAIHAEDVKNPHTDYPRAILYSIIIILSTLILSSLAIAIVVPNNSLSMVSGLMDAFSFFFEAYHMPFATQLIALLIILGSLSSVSAWIIGPTRGLLIAAQDQLLPKAFTRFNRFGAPTTILITQACIFTLLCTVFIFFDSINAAYWALSDLCSQLALIAYIFMFAAVIKLRYSHKDAPRAYKIPGGNLAVWLIALTGILTCAAAMLVGFVPPAQIPIKNTILFELFLISGLFIFLGIPLVIIKKRSKN